MEDKNTSGANTIRFPADLRVDDDKSGNSYTKSWVQIRLGTEKTEDIIVLPTPVDLSFSTSIKYNDISLGLIEGVYDTFKEELSSSGGDVTEALKNTAKSVWSGTVNSSSTKEGGLSTQLAMASALMSTLKIDNGILSPLRDVARRELRNQGIALNPNTELYFQDVGLRGFTFSFRLAPKSFLDSANAMAIVQAFESHAHPGAKSKYLWEYPSEAIITFYDGSSPNDKLPAINKCVITNFSHKYNAGTNVFFENGFPTVIDISVSFKEIAVNTKETINRLNSDTERKQFSKRRATLNSADDLNLDKILPWLKDASHTLDEYGNALTKEGRLLARSSDDVFSNIGF
jgi:hypothetical protein